MLRIGIIGAGSIGAAHARAAKQVAGVKVGAVCDIDREAAERVAADHRADVFTSHSELIEHAGVDAVVVNTPHSLHTDIVLAAARAGLHVLVEKPMATSVADCDAMMDACAEAKVCLVVGHLQRYLPHMAVAGDVIRRGEIGTALAIVDNRTVMYRRGQRPEWFFSPELAGGGVLFNIGAHSIDRAIWLTGQKVSSVTATMLYRGDFEVESDAIVRLDFDNGAVAHITVTDAGTPSRDEIMVIGETAALSVSGASGVILHRGGTDHVHYQPGTDGRAPLAVQLADFVRSVTAGTEPVVDGTHGRDVVATVLAAYESSRTGKAVQPR